MKKKPSVTATRAQVFRRGEEWRFRIKAANGEIIATGEAYTDKRNAVAAAEGLLAPGGDLEVQE